MSDTTDPMLARKERLTSLAATLAPRAEGDRETALRRSRKFDLSDEELREQIAEVTADLIGAEGIEGATARRIAAAVRCSTSIISYHFRDKTDLLRYAFRVYHDALYDGIDAVLARDPADVVGCLMCMAPTDPQRLARWRTYLARCAASSRDENVSRVAQHHIEEAIATIAGVVRASAGPAIDADHVAQQLNTYVQGLSMQVQFNVGAWPPERIRAALTEMVGHLLGPAIGRGSGSAGAPVKGGYQDASGAGRDCHAEPPRSRSTTRP